MNSHKPSNKQGKKVTHPQAFKDRAVGMHIWNESVGNPNQNSC